MADDDGGGPGEGGGFEALFRAFAPRLKAFFMRRGAEVALAEELTQEVMLTVWSKARLYDESRASLATWVFTIARNRHIDVQRRRARPEPDPDDPCFRGGSDVRRPDELLAVEQRRERLRAALAELPEDRRATLELLYFEGCTMAEIAQRQGVPLGTVKSRAKRGMDALRGVLAGAAALEECDE